MTTSGKVLLTTTLVVVLGLVFWFTGVEYKTIEVNTGPTAAVKRNPYLAAEMFSQQRRGKNAFETQHGSAIFDQLPAVEDTIIVADPRYSLGQLHTNALIQWIKQGGHLIVTGQQRYDEKTGKSGDALLDHFGVRVVVYESSHTSDEEAQDSDEQDDEQSDYDQDNNTQSNNDQNNNAQSNTNGKKQTTPEQPQAKTMEDAIQQQSAKFAYVCNEDPLITNVLLSQLNGSETVATENPDQITYNYFMAVNLVSPNILQYDNTANNLIMTATDGYGPQLMQLAIGQGKLTIMSNVDIWRNEELACFDHALLLEQLSKASPKTWLVYYQNQPSLLALLWRNAAILVLSVGLLILLWIWSQTLRFGQQKSARGTVRRNYLEHLEAAARYSWHSGESKILIEQIRQQILHKLTLRQPQFQQWDSSDKIRLISRLTGMTEAVIKQAMFDAPRSDKDSMIWVIQHLQQLRKQLC